MIVHSSRPLPSSEKGKFKPPRPLPRPKNTPTLTSTLAPSRDGGGGETLSATIMVGEKDEKMDSKSGTKSWTIERGRGKCKHLSSDFCAHQKISISLKISKFKNSRFMFVSLFR